MRNVEFDKEVSLKLYIRLVLRKRLLKEKTLLRRHFVVCIGAIGNVPWHLTHQKLHFVKMQTHL